MREMKDSGVEWIGEIPEDWNICLVKNVFNITRGRVIAKTEIEETKTADVYPVYSSQTANNGILGYIPTYDYAVDSLTWTTDGAKAGTVFLRRGKYSITNVCGILTAKKDDCLLEYLYYAVSYSTMNCRRADINGYKIMSNEMAVIPITIPTKEVQKKIVFCLNQKCTQIDTLIQNVQTQIEKLKAYKQSLITEVVTKGLDPTVPMKDSGVEWIGEIPEHWSVAALKYFTDILPGYAFSSNDFHAEAGIPLLRGVNVTPNGIRWDDTVYWNKEITDKLKPFILQLDDIVVGLDRPWISEGTRITRMTEKDLPSLLLQRVCRIRVKASMDSRWVFLGIASNAFKESLSTETTGISVPHISTKQIGDFIVALPSMETQKEICDFIDKKRSQIDRLITSKQAKIEKLEQYKRSLIYEYVTGKKEVRI